MTRSRRGRWKPGTQRAPKLATIAVAALLSAIGAALTFGQPFLIDTLRVSAGVADTLQWVGIGAHVVATVLLLLGIFLEGL